MGRDIDGYAAPGNTRLTGRLPGRSPRMFAPLSNRSLSVLMAAMDRIDSRSLADILETTPPMARLGLTASNSALRARAAEKIASIIVARLDEPEGGLADGRQLVLPIL